MEILEEELDTIIQLKELHQLGLCISGITNVINSPEFAKATGKSAKALFKTGMSVREALAINNGAITHAVHEVLRARRTRGVNGG